ARVFDCEGHIGKIQWAGWMVAFFFLLLLATFDPRFFEHRESGMVFQTPIWIGVCALAAILAATSLVGDRRRGFLDLVLMTPLRPHEIINGTFMAVWQHWRRTYWLPWVIGLIFCLS